MRKLLGVAVFTFVAFQWIASGWLGVLIQDLTPKMAVRYGLSSRSEGVVITRVEFGSPAMKAGLKTGDLIISLNKKKIPDSATLVKEVSKLSPGEKVPLTVMRRRKTLKLSLFVGSAHRFST